MRLTPIILAFIILSGSTQAQEIQTDSSNRVEQDQVAKQFFLATTFFEDGRGMHIAPGGIDWIEQLLPVWAWNSRPSSTDTLISNSKIPSKLANYIGINIIQNKTVGLFKLKYQDQTVGTFGCAVCHSGKAAGVFIPGLGNKVISQRAAGIYGFSVPDSYSKLKKSLKTFISGSSQNDLEKSTARMAEILSNRAFVSPTAGLVENNVVYRTFYEAFGQEYTDEIKGYVNKVPHLWGIVAKRPQGLFYDGAGDSEGHGWTVAVEIMFGQRADTISRPAYLEKIKAVERALDDFLPPQYPFKINHISAEKGAAIFIKTCSKCHGTYKNDSVGLPLFDAPRLIPLEIVKTDPIRAEFFNDPAFWEAASKSSFKDLIKKNPNYEFNRRRYFAPRLNGVWARFPYLHNGSVPSLWHLLNPQDRPEVFSLEDAGERYRFDFVRMGLTVPDFSTREYEDLKKAGVAGSWTTYDTRRLGHGNGGHTFGAELRLVEKINLIEYLKTL